MVLICGIQDRFKRKHRTGGDGDTTLPPAITTKTCGVNSEVSPKSTMGKLSAKDCTTEQLFEIVIDVARSPQRGLPFVFQSTPLPRKDGFAAF